MKKKVFSVGDLVFAKVRGYPAWPARVTGMTSGGKYSVFFYGTYEVGNMKTDEMWPYNQKFLDRFGPPNMRKQWYSEGLYQIEHTPEIAIQQVAVEVAGEADVLAVGDGEHIPDQDTDQVLVKVLSTNELKEINVNENVVKDCFIKLDNKPIKMECNVEEAERMLQEEDPVLNQEVKEDLKAKVEAVQKKDIVQKKIEKLNWLKCEQKLVDIVCQIQLSMVKSKINTVKCLEMLTLMNEMDIKPLMVIKMPEVYMTVKKLSSLAFPNIDGAAEVRELSERISLKIIRDVCVGLPVGLGEFDDILEKKVNEFKMRTSDLSDRERLSIITFEDG